MLRGVQERLDSEVAYRLGLYTVPEDWWRVKTSVDGQTIDSIDFGYSVARRTNRSCEIRIESAFEVNEAERVGSKGL